MIPARPREDITLAELGRTLYGVVCSACHGFETAYNPAAPNFATLKGVNQRLTLEQVLELPFESTRIVREGCAIQRDRTGGPRRRRLAGATR